MKINLEAAAKRKAKRRAKAKTLWVNRPMRMVVVRKLDKIFSLYIRLRDKRPEAQGRGFCVVCKIRPVEVCYHLIPRAHYATRWNTANAVGACAACNFGEKMHRLAYREKHIKIVGPFVYSQLEELAKKPNPYTTADLLVLLANFKNKFEHRIFT